MHYIIIFLILIDSKKDNYDSIFVIVNYLPKIIYYKLVKIVIHNSNMAKYIINIVMKYYSFLDLIVIN